MRYNRAALLPMALAAVVAFAADDPPDWVRQAAAQPVPSYPAKVTSVVLFREEAVTVDFDGKRVMHERGVVKVIQPGGERVEAHRYYNAKSGRIRDFQGWLIPPTGKPTAFAKSKVADLAASANDVYDEDRVKVLECGCPAPGSVFAWDVTEEERSIFTQDLYRFQDSDPVLVSRYVVTLPADWEAKGMVFNREIARNGAATGAVSISTDEPQVAGNTYTWESRNLPWIEHEDHSPTLAALAPRLVVSYFPPAGNRAGLQGLKDWAAVSAWLSPLVDPPAEGTDAVRAKAIQLTANAATETDKIRAIAAFVQQINYVEVDLNLTHAGGYTPRRSEDTLARNYGDCKDKATLMRALLKAVSIDTYLTVITAGDRTYVRPEWASPMQFNHAIVAVRVSDAIALPTVLDTSLGRLLIFDPTDRITPLGDLPQHEQGSQALVIAGTRGALLKMPVLPAEASRIESVVDATVDGGGKLEAQIHRGYFGQSSMPLRSVEKLQGKEELQKRFERGFIARIGGASLKSIETATAPEENQLSVTMDLTAERFGQDMQGRLFIVRPGLLTSGGDYFFRTKQRSAPIRLESDLRRDSIKIKLPAGFKLDELPDAAKIEGPYGRLEVSWTVSGDVVSMNQTFEIRETVAPASDYPQIRDFFDHVSGAQGAAVVLVKQ